MVYNYSLSLNLAGIESDRYGTAKNLKATLPLLTGGSYKVPEVCADRKKLISIAREIASTYRNHWPTSTDWEAILKAAHGFLLVAYQCPNMVWETDFGFRAIVTTAVTSIALDHLVDRLLEIHPAAKNLKMFLAFTATFGNSDIDFEQIFSSQKDDPASSMYLMGVMLNGFHKSIRKLGQLETGESGGRKSLDHVLAELLSTSTATFCTLLEKSSETTRFSSQGFKRHIGQQAHGMRFCIEANLLATPGPELSPKIRNSLLFRMLLDSFGNATALINAICGLRKDVLEDTWEDTTILRDVVLKGLTLEESWENAVQDFAGEVHDMNLALALLRDTYEDEDGLEEFLQVFYDTFMGTCFAYVDEFAASRYVGTTVKVHTLKEDEISLTTTNAPSERKVRNVGEVGGLYFGINSEGLKSNMQELLISGSAESLGLEGLCLGIQNEEELMLKQPA